MIRIKIFEKYGIEHKMEEFIKENNITQDQIISISFAIDAQAHARLGEYSTQQILLAWEDNK